MNRPDKHEQMIEKLSAYLDGELTQADSQRVRLYLDENVEARQAFDEMSQLQHMTAEIRFRNPPDELMDALAQRFSVQAPRRFGWGMVIMGLVAWVVYAAATVARNLRWPSWPELFTGAAIAGLVMVFVSVLRQRILERPHDRYRKVRR